MFFSYVVQNFRISLLSFLFSAKTNFICSDIENVIRSDKFMLLLRIFSSMEMNKNALSFSLRLGTFLACS